MLFSSNYKTLSVLVLVILFFGLAAFLNLSSSSFLQAATSPDAIAFRVMPNPGHLSPLRWYQENIKLKGSPQGLTVDGYEAVRDGRTVYVNAANIDLSKTPATFYSNIYIISYNQQAESATVDIFGQILAHWKFNTNLTPEQKINVRKDTKRLADLADINLALDNYQKAHNGDYPALSAGSYLSGKSVSVWPSWQATLAKELGVILPEDPDNKLGACLGYDPVTCWDQRNKKFYDPIPDNNFDLPANSHAYVYSYNGKKSYNTCALMQSGFLTTLAQGACAGSAAGSGTGSGVGYEVKCEDKTWTYKYPPDSVCENDKVTGTSNCGTVEKVNGTKKDTVWTPRTSLDQVCENQPVTEDGDCGGTQEVQGEKVNHWLLADSTKICPNKYVPETGDCNGVTRDSLTNGTKIETFPNADSTKICPSESITVTGDCGSTKEIQGTKVDTIWTPRTPLAQVCKPDPVIADGDCFLTTKQMSGDKCCATCNNGSDQPNCQATASAPVNAQVVSSGICCLDETCYKCPVNYLWDSGSNSCKLICGDGVKQVSEKCDYKINDVKDPSGQIRCEILKDNLIKDSDGLDLDCANIAGNALGLSGISNLYKSVCKQDCTIGCQQADIKQYLGMGCYNGQTDPNDPKTGTVGCQKGAFICSPSDVLACDINFFSPPKWDYCCNNEANKIKNGQVGTFYITRAEQIDLDSSPLTFTGYYRTGTYHYYTCDNVCKRVGRVCIGVGLNDSATNACISIVHDTGNGMACSCSTLGNQNKDDCRSRFSLAGSSDALILLNRATSFSGYTGVCESCPFVNGLSPNYRVGETACYCQ